MSNEQRPCSIRVGELGEWSFLHLQYWESVAFFVQRQHLGDTLLDVSNLKGPRRTKISTRSKCTTRSEFTIALWFTIAARLVRTPFPGKHTFSFSKKGPQRSKFGGVVKTLRRCNSLFFSIVVVFLVRKGPLGSSDRIVEHMMCNRVGQLQNRKAQKSRKLEKNGRRLANLKVNLDDAQWQERSETQILRRKWNKADGQKNMCPLKCWEMMRWRWDHWLVWECSDHCHWPFWLEPPEAVTGDIWQKLAKHRIRFLLRKMFCNVLDFFCG